MPRTGHNAAGFRYVVEYRRLAPNSTSQTVVISDWTVGELVMDNQPVFAAYEISVRAANSVGTAPDNQLHVRIGYSAEDGQFFGTHLLNTGCKLQAACI